MHRIFHKRHKKQVSVFASVKDREGRNNLLHLLSFTLWIWLKKKKNLIKKNVHKLWTIHLWVDYCWHTHHPFQVKKNWGGSMDTNIEWMSNCIIEISKRRGTERVWCSAIGETLFKVYFWGWKKYVLLRGPFTGQYIYTDFSFQI